MNCRLARRYFPWFTSPVAGEDGDPDMLAAREHFQHCTACQSEWRSEQAADACITERMRKIPLPEDLIEKLRHRAAASRVAPVVMTGCNNRRKRVWQLAIVATALLLLAGLPLTWWLQPPPLALSSLLAELGEIDSVDHWPAAGNSLRPVGWSTIAELSSEPARRQPASAAQVVAIGFRFIPRPSGPPIAGMLWMIDSRRLTGVDTLRRLEDAPIQYRPDSTRLVWLENGHVFVLEVRGNPAGLHRLQSVLRSSRTFA